jgi:hypothetical protein
LCIDAFSINPIPRSGLKCSSGEGCNRTFLFQWTPLNRRFRVFPRHLHPATSGPAGSAGRDVADSLIAEVKQTDSSLVLIFTSVNGDDEYGDSFRAAFSSISPFLDGAEFDEVFRAS